LKRNLSAAGSLEAPPISADQKAAPLKPHPDHQHPVRRDPISADQKAAPLKLRGSQEKFLVLCPYFRRSKGGSVEATFFRSAITRLKGYFRRSKGGSVEASEDLFAVFLERNSISADQKAAPLKQNPEKTRREKKPVYFRRSKGGSVEATEIKENLTLFEKLFPPIKRRLR